MTPQASITNVTALEACQAVPVELCDLKVPAVFYFVTGLSSIVGNSLIIRGHVRDSSIRQPPYTVPALAQSDMLLGVSAVVKSLVPYYSTCTFSHRVCSFIESTQVYSLAIAPIYIVTQSTVRLIGFVKPLWYLKLKDGHGVTVSFQIIAQLTGILPLISMYVQSDPLKLVPICTMPFVVPRTTSMITNGYFLIMMIIAIGINIKLWYASKQYLKKKGPSSATAVRDARLAVSLIIITGVYVGTLLTSGVLYFALTKFGSRANFVTYGFTFTGQLPVVNSAANFFIYMLRSKEYRTAIFGAGKNTVVSVVSIKPPPEVDRSCIEPRAANVYLGLPDQ